MWLCAAAPLAAQGPGDGVGTAARTGVVFDGYYFGSSYAFHHVVEWTVPVGLSHRLGPSLTVDLSSGYAHAAAATTSGTLELSGPTDTDVRLSWASVRSEEHTSELQSQFHLVCRLLLEKKKKKIKHN